MWEARKANNIENVDSTDQHLKVLHPFSEMGDSTSLNILNQRWETPHWYAEMADSKPYGKASPLPPAPWTVI